MGVLLLSVMVVLEAASVFCGDGGGVGSDIVFLVAVRDRKVALLVVLIVVLFELGCTHAGGAS